MIETEGDGLIPFPAHRLGAGEALPCPIFSLDEGTPIRWHEAGEPIPRKSLEALTEELVFIEATSLSGFASFLTGRMERALDDSNESPQECALRLYDAGWAVLTDYFGHPEVVEARAKVTRLARAMTTASLCSNVLSTVIECPPKAGSAIHGVRVAAMALVVARGRGLGDASSRRLAEGALLHDLGEVVMPQIDSDGPSDWATSAHAQHPSVGFGLLRAHGNVDPIITACVLSHHERLHGRGFPYGLSGAAIPLAGRIVGLADALDEEWAIRPDTSLEISLDRLLDREPDGFDTDLVEALISALEA